ISAISVVFSDFSTTFSRNGGATSVSALSSRVSEGSLVVIDLSSPLVLATILLGKDPKVEGGLT
ncbi:hypothetical protein, partial [Bacillus cereus group sp. BC60]|uniref:hypothetical protein n=1 Tax=Bacillus cereus group sp. BC60 TaxID=3445283 RepID=UPI003F23A7EB